jgi:hypothetical protein
VWVPQDFRTAGLTSAILDGRAGWRYAKERFVAEWLLLRELRRR